jgi:hypothetical protein
MHVMDQRRDEEAKRRRDNQAEQKRLDTEAEEEEKRQQDSSRSLQGLQVDEDGLATEEFGTVSEEAMPWMPLAS